MSGVYKQLDRNYTQELIHKMIQSVVHLKYYIPRRTEIRQDGFHTEFEGVKIAFYPNGIDFGLGEGTHGYLKQIKWELHRDSDAIVPQVANLTPLDDSVRQPLGRVLRHWLDTTE